MDIPGTSQRLVDMREARLRLAIRTFGLRQRTHSTSRQIISPDPFRQPERFACIAPHLRNIQEPVMDLRQDAQDFCALWLLSRTQLPEHRGQLSVRLSPQRRTTESDPPPRSQFQCQLVLPSLRGDVHRLLEQGCLFAVGSSLLCSLRRMHEMTESDRQVPCLPIMIGQHFWWAQLDSLLPYGMSDAFHDAELLSEAVARGLSGEVSMLEALARHEQERNAYSLPLYEMNSQMATLEPPAPEMLQMFEAMQGNQEQIKRYIAVLGGSASPSSFFSPANIAEIKSGAAAKS
jgi:hypothetical protein